MLNEVRINSNLRLYFSEDCVEPNISQLTNQNQIMIAVFDLMSLYRTHAIELQQVYDSAPFLEKQAVSNAYFVCRVRSGGAWDYKAYLGTNTVYILLKVPNNCSKRKCIT